MTKLLVTGGAGFIGSNFIRYWMENHKEDKIVNLDKLTYAGHLSSTKDFSDNPNYKFVQGDICDVKLVDSLMREIDTVVHFAAESHVDRSIDSPDVFIKTNIEGTHVLLKSALNNKIKRFHHISTDEVFGALELNDEKFNESTRYDPHSPYSASKASSDHLVRAYKDTYGLPITITNCANNFGPYHDPEKLFSRSITNLIDGQPIQIYGDGKYVRDWTHTEDHVRAIELVLEKGVVGETYLVGSMTKEFNNLEIAQKLLKIFDRDESFIPLREYPGRKSVGAAKKFSLRRDSAPDEALGEDTPTVRLGSFIKFVKDRPGHDRRYAIDSTKITQLGWKPKYDFDTWLGKTVDWFKDNEWWWRPLKQKAEELYKKTGQI